MADFLLTTRDRTGRDAESRWRRLKFSHDDLVEGDLTAGPWLVRWSAGRCAPVSTWRDGDRAALVLGIAVDGPGGTLGAAEVARRVLADPEPTSWALDGYFVAVVCHGARAVVVSDVLGLFPVYRGDAGATYAASLPLPAGGDAPDSLGLAGLLAFHGAIGGRTLLPGVTRVAPGHALVVDDTGAAERRSFEWPDEETFAERPLDDQDELLHNAFARALEAQLPATGPVGLLLTGGRDSRTLAGRLAHLGREFVARTVGHPHDHDAVLARKVAGLLGARHEVRALPTDAFTRGLDIHLSCDHLATGASQCWWRGAGPALDGLPDRSVTGHVFDVIVGGMMRTTGALDFGMDVPWEFARPFERRSGVSDEVLAGLRDPRAQEGVAWAEDTMRDAFEGQPLQHLWRWILAHWVRFQVGMVLHPIAFRSWPIVPVLDRALIDTSARLDSRSFGFRQGQDRMLLRYYPRMASISHTVENADPGLALAPSLLDRVRARILPGKDGPGPVGWRGDRRFVWRNTDFFNPGWSALREKAEPLRPLLHELVEPAALDAYLPPPGGALQQVDFASHQGPKLLVALALWLERHG